MNEVKPSLEKREKRMAYIRYSKETKQVKERSSQTVPQIQVTELSLQNQTTNPEQSVVCCGRRRSKSC